MLKFTFSLIILCLCHGQLPAQTREERKELIGLVEQRQELFNIYSAALKKKSGFFGQKTKNDLRSTHDRLKDIVEMDNKIMTRLKQMLSYRNFEKQTMSYDVNQYSEQLKNFERAQDTLVKQLAKMEKENAILNKSVSKSGRWIYFLFGFLFALILFRLRRRFQ